MITYRDLVHTFRAGPREVPTAPLNGKLPKWFYVYERQNEVWVSSGRAHSNPCRICPARKLQAKELPVMLDLYLRRKRGEPVSQEAGRQSVNQSYWFGIFKALAV